MKIEKFTDVLSAGVRFYTLWAVGFSYAKRERNVSLSFGVGETNCSQGNVFNFGLFEFSAAILENGLFFWEYPREFHNPLYTGEESEIGATWDIQIQKNIKTCHLNQV